MFTDLVKNLADENNIQIKKMLNDLDIADGSFNNWKNRNTVPSGIVVAKIAVYFNVSTDYLLGLTDNPNTAANNLTENEQDALKILRSIPDERQRTKFVGYMEAEANFLFQDEMHSVKPDMLSFFEKDIINKYRKLDKYGKEAVENLLNTETKRIDDFKKQKVLADTEQEYAKIIYFDTPVSAGTGEFLDNDNYIMLDVLEEPPFGAEFIVRVCGDSMEPTYKDGDKLYVKPQDSVSVGKIGIFSINGDVYVKERAEDGLISHNKKYSEIMFNEYDNIKCFGQVLGVCKKYR